MTTQLSPQLATLLSRTSCNHRHPSGKRCRYPLMENSLFCPRHSQPDFAPTQVQDIDLSPHFGSDPLNFKSASEVNDFLCSLARLMIENRISARRASVLAYIASLELRTLPAIEHELGVDEYEEVPRLIFERPAEFDTNVRTNAQENVGTDGSTAART
jgi:hypothetical protein